MLQCCVWYCCNFEKVVLKGGVDNCRTANIKLFDSTSHICRILVGQLKGKSSECCHKDVKNVSQTYQRFWPRSGLVPGHGQQF